VAVHEVHKGENVGWYLDQRLISILVSDWIKQHGRSRVKLVPRDTDTDRSVYLCFIMFTRTIHKCSVYEKLSYLTIKYEKNAKSEVA